MSEPLALPQTLMTEGAVLGLRHDGATLDDAGRRDLLGQVRAGTFAGTLHLDIVAFVQRETPNRKAVRFKPSALRRFARSFGGVPFLRDHDHSQLARGGTVLSGELVTDGDPAFRQTIELVKPWAMEGALDGTLDRFSIGFRITGEALCTICGRPILSRECGHLPGDRVEVRGGVRVCEVLVTDAEGVETSAVTVPAVEGTGVEAIRAALSAVRERRGGRPPQKGTIMDGLRLLAGLVGLGEGASEEDVYAAVKKLQADHEHAQVLLAAEKEAHRQTQAALAAARDALAQRDAKELAAATDALIEGAIREGKLRPQLAADGKTRIETPIEKAIRRTAELGGLEAARQYVADLPALLPIGRAQVSIGPDPHPPPTTTFTAAQLEVWRSMGVKPEDVAKYGGPTARLAEEA